jgi:GGDEF domain-containing protein
LGNTLRVRDKIIPKASGGDESVILFIGAEPKDAARAIDRLNKVSALVFSKPLGDLVKLQDVEALKHKFMIEPNEIEFLISLANKLRSQISEKISRGEFERIKSVEKFNEVFCRPRLVSLVSKIGDKIYLEWEKTYVKVEADGRLHFANGEEYFQGKIEFGKPQKITAGGKSYVIVADAESDKVTVYHEVKGLSLSAGIGANIELATSAQMLAKKMGKGGVVVESNGFDAATKAAENPVGFTREQQEAHLKYKIAETTNKIQYAAEKVENGKLALGDVEVLRLYQQGFAELFGTENVKVSGDEIQIGGQGAKLVGTIEVGNRIIEVKVAFSESALIVAAKEFVNQIELIQTNRSNLTFIQNTNSVDPLSGFMNKDSYLSKLTELLEDIKASGKGRLSVHFFDLNDFKGINEKLGYKSTNGLIEIVSQICRESASYFIKEEAYFSRLMGDEFSIASTAMSSPEFNQAATRMNEVLEIVLGVDPNIPEIKPNANGEVVLSDGRGLEVSSKVLEAANKIRSRVIKRVNGGKVSNFTFEMLGRVIDELRKGRGGEVPGGVRASGGTVVVSSQDLGEIRLQIVAQSAVEKAGIVADDLKDKRKATGQHTIDRKDFREVELKASEGNAESPDILKQAEPVELVELAA